MRLLIIGGTVFVGRHLAEQALAHIPANRLARPEEMAGAVLYLVSSAASYTTGACLPVDGGYLLV